MDETHLVDGSARQEPKATYEELIAKLLEAAKEVCWFDWSDNDDDAVEAVENLRAAIARVEART